MPDSEQKSTPQGDADKVRRAEETLRRRDVEQLIQSASGWMSDAMDAWSDEDYQKVALLAPLAVEHLGKALLWKKNPVLVVPLLKDAEASLVKLATAPSLADPKLRTIGLGLLLSRIEAATGQLPLNGDRRNRMVEIRNGAMHVAASEPSRYVLIDSLTVCNVFLERLGHEPTRFYGDHKYNVSKLVEQGRSDVQHRVAAKLARARKSLTALEKRLGKELFEVTTDRLQADAQYVLDPQDGPAIDRACPECGSDGRLAGRIDLEPHIEYDFEPGVDEPGTPYTSGWEITLFPDVFACNVCGLTLGGIQELAAAGLSSDPCQIDADELGSDFDPELAAERLYGIND